MVRTDDVILSTLHLYSYIEEKIYSKNDIHVSYSKMYYSIIGFPRFLILPRSYHKFTNIVK